MSARFYQLVLMFSRFAEDLGEAIYKPIESTALFAVNQASTPARIAVAGGEARLLNKSSTERKYTFSPAASMARVSLLGHWPAYLRYDANLR